MKRSVKVLGVLSLLFTLSCKQQEVQQESSASQEPAHTAPVAQCSLDRLGLPQSLGSPSTIDEATNLINALPKPVTIECFLQALNRPLYVQATSSNKSAQPAEGRESPRVFIYSDDLLISVVMGEGESSFLVEYGQIINDRRTLKGELEFPIASEIPLTAPYDHIALGQEVDGGPIFGTTIKTKCGTCHTSEYTNHDISDTKAFDSKAFKPVRSSRVYLSTLRNENYLCGINKENTRRCRLYDSLMNYGDVLDYEFPDDMETFF